MLPTNHQEEIRENFKNWLYTKDGNVETFKLPSADDVADYFLQVFNEEVEREIKEREQIRLIQLVQVPGEIRELTK